MHVAFLNPQGNFDASDAFLTEHPDFGGQLVYVKEVGMALARQGIAVDIVTRRIEDEQWPCFSEQIGYYHEDNSGPRIVRIDCGGRRFLRKEQLWRYLDEWVGNIVAFYDGHLPDAFTAHYADGGYSAALLKQKTGRLFTFTSHSLGAQKIDKLGMTPDNADEMEREYCFSRRIAAERIAMQEAFSIITSTRQERFDQYGHPLYKGAVDIADDSRFAVIPPGVNEHIFTTGHRPGDSEVQRRLAHRIGDGTTPWIVASSRLDEKKNILGIVTAYAGSTALQAQARLGIFIRGIKDPYLDISGLSAAEQAVLQPILDTITGAGIRERTAFIDVRSQQALAASYRFFAQRGSVFALTSFYEPFGLAPIEAAACGLAVVATANGGPVEIFADGSGILVDPFDSDAIARGLLECLQHQSELAQRGIERVRSNYTWDRTAVRYLDVLRNGIAQGTQAGVSGAPDLQDNGRLRGYLEQKAARSG